MRSLFTVGAAAALIGVFAGALVAPKFVARVYGIALEDENGEVYLRGVGSRDAVLGILILRFLATNDRAALRTAIALTSLAGVSDFLLVLAKRGIATPNLSIHALGTAGLVALYAATPGADGQDGSVS